MCVQPDWDMFHSKHPAALLHATARVVSGSGVYVSDKPGAHDFELLRRIVLPDGSVQRPLLPGRPTKDILFADVLKDNKTLLKVLSRLRLYDCVSLLCCNHCICVHTPAKTCLMVASSRHRANGTYSLLAGLPCTIQGHVLAKQTQCLSTCISKTGNKKPNKPKAC